MPWPMTLGDYKPRRTKGVGGVVEGKDGGGRRMMTKTRTTTMTATRTTTMTTKPTMTTTTTIQQQGQ